MPSTVASASILAGRLANNCLSRRRIQMLNLPGMFFCTGHNSENGSRKRNPSRNWFYLVSLLIVGASGGVLYRRVTEKRRTPKRTLEQAVQETRTIIKNLQAGGVLYRDIWCIYVRACVLACGRLNFFPYACSGQWQFSTVSFSGFGLGFWVVITIIVSLTLTLTLNTTLTVILP